MISSGRTRIDYISKEKVVLELKRVRVAMGGGYFGKREFDAISNFCKSTKVISMFGSWGAALREIGVTEKPVRSSRKDKIDDDELVAEIARVWKLLEHRPSKTEWEYFETKYGYTTIKQRFLGWTNACNEALRLLESGIENVLEGRKVENDKEQNSVPDNREIMTEEKRTIPLKLRLKILRRDRYKCVLCGRNPSSDPNVELHIDHVLPFSLGGKTEEANLRTLCRECNIGRGNDKSF